MFVTETARRRGVAACILTELEALAREHGVTVLRLETGISQPEAIALYDASASGSGALSETTRRIR